jgi:hypothetical protein
MTKRVGAGWNPGTGQLPAPTARLSAVTAPHLPRVVVEPDQALKNAGGCGCGQFLQAEGCAKDG